MVLEVNKRLLSEGNLLWPRVRLGKSRARRQEIRPKRAPVKREEGGKKVEKVANLKLHKKLSYGGGGLTSAVTCVTLINQGNNIKWDFRCIFVVTEFIRVSSVNTVTASSRATNDALNNVTALVRAEEPFNIE